MNLPSDFLLGWYTAGWINIDTARLRRSELRALCQRSSQQASAQYRCSLRASSLDMPGKATAGLTSRAGA